MAKIIYPTTLLHGPQPACGIITSAFNFVFHETFNLGKCRFSAVRVVIWLCFYANFQINK